MSRTKKEGKRSRRVPAKEDPGIKDTIYKRHAFGSTEKILRRNRKTWVRLGNKRRRQLDKDAVKNSDT